MAEAVLGQRQAYISQHLMALRKAGVEDIGLITDPKRDTSGGGGQ